jgi:hypothetical protein
MKRPVRGSVIKRNDVRIEHNFFHPSTFESPSKSLLPPNSWGRFDDRQAAHVSLVLTAAFLFVGGVGIAGLQPAPYSPLNNADMLDVQHSDVYIDYIR